MSDLNKRLARVEQQLNPQPRPGVCVLWPNDPDAETRRAEAERNGDFIIRVVYERRDIEHQQTT